MTLTLLSDLWNSLSRFVGARGGGWRPRDEREGDGDFLDFMHRDQGALLDAELASFDALAHGFRR